MKEHIEGVGKLADMSLHFEIESWLKLEAELLDTYQERAWLDRMVSKDVVYQLPIRRTVERNRGMGFVNGAFHLDERFGSLHSKVVRNETGLAWAEDPASRVRHFITNVRVGERQGDIVRVRSNCLLFRTRLDNTEPNLLSCERHDTLTYEVDGWRLLKRVVYLDHTAIGTHNLAIFF